MLNHEDHVAADLDDYVNEILPRSKASAIERHCATCPACQTALIEARKRRSALEAVPPCEASTQLIGKIMHKIDEHERRRRRFRKAYLWTVLTAAAASIFIVVALQIYYTRLAPSPYDLAVIGQGQLFPGAPGSLCIRLTNHAAGSPLANVPVEFGLYRDLSSKAGAKAVSLGSFQTNAQGIGQPRFQVPNWADGDYELYVVARPEGKTEEVTHKVKLQRSWKLMVSSDKPVYQPGQEIHVRALALARPDLKPVAKQEAVFTIADSKGNIIFKQQRPTSSYGITSADCLLASEVNEGPYTITCKLGDTESKLTVEVKKYVLPKFKVDVAGLDGYYMPGQVVKGSVKADYFFGGAVAGGEVKIELRTAEVPGKVEGPSPAGQPPRKRHGSTPAPVPTPNQLQVVKVKTDETGQAAFEIKLPAVLVGREQESGDARIVLHVTVRDTAGQEEKKTVSRLVTSKPLRVTVIPESGSLVPGVANTIYFYASYADGRPAEHLELVLIRSSNTNGVANARTTNITTNAAGLASVEVTSEVQEQLTISANDDKGHTLKEQVSLNLGGVHQDFILRTDKAVYNGGDTMRLTALGRGSGTVYVDLIKDGQTYLSDTIFMANGKGEAQVDLPAELFGTVELCAYRFGEEGLPVRKTRVLYISQARQLNIKVTPDLSEYRPGRPAKMQFQLTDRDGKPTPGALSLAAVDEAVFSVLDQAPGMERTFALLEQELLKPVYAVYPWSPDRVMPALGEDRGRFEQALFSRTVQTDSVRSSWSRSGRGWRGRSMAMDMEEMPQQTARALPHSIAIFSFSDKAREIAAKRDTALGRIATAWGLLVASLFLTGYASIWMFLSRKWILVSHVVGLFMMCPMSCILITLIGENSSMTFAKVASDSPASVANDDDSAETGSAKVRVRQYFPETLLWKPELITDDQGRASLDFAVADSITTWRMTSSAVSADGRLGGTQTPIRVFQPFFVDLNLPVALTRGDEVSIPVVVYNYLDKPQTVELTLDDANWFERLDDAAKKMELKAKEVRSTSYRLKVRKVGTHELLVTARGSDLSDAIKRSIEVVPDGQKVEQVIADRLTGNVTQTIAFPEHTVPDSSKIIVKLYPGVFSQLVEGIDGLLHMPYG